MSKITTVPTEISDFYYWFYENYGGHEANDWLDVYLEFKTANPGLPPEGEKK